MNINVFILKMFAHMREYISTEDVNLGRTTSEVTSMCYCISVQRKKLLDKILINTKKRMISYIRSMCYFYEYEAHPLK